MDSAESNELIEKIKKARSPFARPPNAIWLVTLEEFFVGNDHYGSIGYNFSPMLGSQFFL